MKKSYFRNILLVFFAAVFLLVTFIYGVISGRRENLPFKIVRYLNEQKNEIFSSESDRITEGYWHVARNNIKNDGLTEEQKEALAKVTALPYLKGYNPAPDVKNVTVYDREATQDGFNLVISGHGPEASLIDMEGNVLHKWRKEFDQVWPDFRDDLDRNELYQTFWRRAHVYNNGDLLAIFRDFGLIKLDKNSELLWAYDGRCHHDLFVKDNGDIYVLSRQVGKNPRLKLQSWRADEPYWEDFIVVLNSRGVEKKKVSMLDCFLDSDYAPMLEHIKVTENILHTNAIMLIDAPLADKHPIFNEGQILVSFREIHTIAVIDLEQEKVTWALTGMWNYQHEPSLLANGDLLLFDNRGNNRISKIIELNPLTQEVVWIYKGTQTKKFFSATAGTTQRLANGNTLITESNNGRAFEVTPSGKIVWEFFNPNRTGENNELIAALYDVVRLDKNKFNWLTESKQTLGASHP